MHEMWLHRNLDELPLDSPEVTALRSAALSELEIGMASLPALYHHYFNVSPAKLLDMVTLDLRIWFRTIRIF